MKEGRLLQLLNLRRSANPKRGAFLKLGANSSIYGICFAIYFSQRDAREAKPKKSRAIERGSGGLFSRVLCYSSHLLL